jgi:hypothetical protein
MQLRLASPLHQVAAPAASWLLHGITIRVSADTERSLTWLSKALRLPPSSGVDSRECLHVAIRTELRWEPPAWVRRVIPLWSHAAYQLGQVDGDPVVLYAHAAWARLFTAEQRIDIAGTASLLDNEFALTQLLFMPLLAPALRQWGLLPLHACAVDWHGRSLVFPAVSGSGKSTLALALLRGGFKLISDDMPILRRQGDGSFRLLPFPERSRLRPDSLRFFPELATIGDWAEPSGDKLLFDPAVVFGDCFASVSRPVALVLPRIAQTLRSELQPLSASSALAALISGMAFGATGDSMGALLPDLCDFVESCRTFTLATGTDFDDLPALLRILLEQE